MITSVSLKKQIHDSAESDLKLKRRHRLIANCIFVPLGIITYAVFILSIIGVFGFITFGLGAIGFGIILFAIGYYVFNSIDNMHPINRKASNISNPILKKAFEKALNEICVKASNQGIQYSFLKEIEEMMENNYSSWFKKSGSFNIDWLYELENNETPIIIDDAKHFLQSIEILDEDYKYIDDEGKLIVKIDLLRVDKSSNPMNLKPLQWIIPVEIQ